MAKSQPEPTAGELRQLSARLDEQRSEMTRLRRKLDVQFKRISDLLAELDTLPATRKRRPSLRALTQSPPPSSNGNGRGHG